MEDGRTAHPFVLLVINPQLEIILGFDILPDQPEKEEIVRFLHTIIQNPPKESYQKPHRPKRILFESLEMALDFRTDLGAIGIEADFQSPPPHIAQLIAEIEDMLEGNDPTPPGLLSIEGVTAEMVGDLFSAAADYFLAAPWTALSDTQPLKVRFEQIENPAYIQLMGKAGLEYGLIMYWDWDDLIHTYITADDPLEQVPPGGWRSLTFENADLLPWEDLNAIEEYGWNIASENAHPLIITYTRTSVKRPTREELILYEALLRAIPEFVISHMRPDYQGDFFETEATFNVQSHKGTMEVTFNYPAGELPDELFDDLSTGFGENDIEWIPRENEKNNGNIDDLAIPDPRVMEGFLFRSLDEGNQEEPDSELGKAQRIIYEAWDEADPDRRIQLAHKAVEISPDCADAYVLLAEEEAESLQEARDYYLKGIKAGERILGDDFFKENTGHFWGLVETRPYMRARFGLAECLALMGKHGQAITQFKELLILNPNDHQGARYNLMTSLLHMFLDREAQELIDLYTDDGSIIWAYSRALLTFRQEGNSQQASKELRDAIELNSHVPDFLTGQVPLPDEIPEFEIPGGESEAAYYVQDNYTNWWRTKGAIEWLKSIDNQNKTRSK
jgi:tetratricopeptide (TPR) repeat protein